MDRNRANSMTEQGQLKLAPIIICIQESNQLYDFCVKFLFKLHDSNFPFSFDVKFIRSLRKTKTLQICLVIY